LNPKYKTIVLWIVLIIVFVAIYQTLRTTNQGQKIDFSDFYHRAIPSADDASTQPVVAKITVRGNEIQGEYADGTRFRTVGDIKPIERDLMERNIRVIHESNEQSGFWLTIIGTWLPMIFLFLIFIFFMRQLQSGGGKAMSFGKSRHNVLDDANNRITFEDIAGIEEAKEELQEIIQFLKDPKKFTRLGGRIPKGVLLMGAPGTGKTLLARGVAGEAEVPFFTISGSDFVEMFVGVGASRVRDLFEQGKKNAPCIIFIDEIDAVGRHRGAGLGGGHDEREQTLNQLLVEMDGFESNEGVIIVAATNRPDVLDPALLRPGRFDRRVMVQLPDVKGREGILKVHTRRTPLGKDVKLDIIARGTPGFSGADLENLVNEAALFAARNNKDFLEATDFEYAKDKVLMGSERRSMVISDEQKRETAYHEAGHTLVAMKTPGADPVHKVTIIPRGPSLGLTQQLPQDDKWSQNNEEVLGIITVLMGGRAAEDLIFGKPTTGAGNDIERATALARRYVTEWGMSNLGPVYYGQKQGPVFLGRDLHRQTELSEQMAIRIDREVQRILMTQYDLAVTVLEDNRDALEAIAEGLLEFETLDTQEIVALIDGVDPEELRKRRTAREEEVKVAALAAKEPERPVEEEQSVSRPTPSIVPLKPGDEKT
jgi:cell division protease FtsH